MSFEWDHDKDLSNRQKHGISFDEAKHIFDGPVLTKIDDRDDYGEVREISIGTLSLTGVITVVHTQRGDNIRLISARKADRRERKIYYDYLQKTLERD